jgi:membrane-associated protein
MVSLSALQVDSPVSYVVAFVLPALDAILPALPSETAIVALGVTTAGSWNPLVAVLVAVAAAGAFAGDNLCYLLGRRYAGWAERRFFAGRRGARRRTWAVNTLDRHGARLIILCRFIPAGRTAVTLTCGITGYPRQRFVASTALAAGIWASYAFALGRLGGKTFQQRPWAALVLALAAALAVSATIEVARLIAYRRTRHGRTTTG